MLSQCRNHHFPITNNLTHKRNTLVFYSVCKVCSHSISLLFKKSEVWVSIPVSVQLSHIPKLCTLVYLPQQESLDTSINRSISCKGCSFKPRWINIYAFYSFLYKINSNSSALTSKTLLAPFHIPILILIVLTVINEGHNAQFHL